MLQLTSTYLRKFADGAREDRSLTRAAQQRLPSRDREGVVNANLRNLALVVVVLKLGSRLVVGFKPHQARVGFLDGLALLFHQHPGWP
jgi:hypothetical protein